MFTQCMWNIIFTLHTMTRERICLIFHSNITDKREDNKSLRKERKKNTKSMYITLKKKRVTLIFLQERISVVYHVCHTANDNSSLHDIVPCCGMNTSKQSSRGWPDSAHRYTEVHWHEYNYQNTQLVRNSLRLV